MEPINKVIETVKERFEKIGLYVVDVNVATNDQDALASVHGHDHSDNSEEGSVKDDFRKKMADGETMWVMQAEFNIGDQAFSDRVLNPEKYVEDTEFALAVPSEIEILRERMRREGLAAFEPDDEVDE